MYQETFILESVSGVTAMDTLVIVTLLLDSAWWVKLFSSNLIGGRFFKMYFFNTYYGLFC